MKFKKNILVLMIVLMFSLSFSFSAFAEEVGPSWTSDPQHHELGTHHWLLDQGLNILYNDGYSVYRNYIQNTVYNGKTLYEWMVEGIDDADAGYFGSNLFLDHFYNPDTGLGLSYHMVSAKDKVVELYSDAVISWNAGARSEAFYKLGGALHFLQDMGNPHHTSDFSALNYPIGLHQDFESYTETNQGSWRVTKGGNYNYAGSPAYWASNLANYSHSKFYLTDDYNQTDWNSALSNCLPLTQKVSAGFIYKFMAENW